MFSTPKEVATQAVDNDVHIIGGSSQAAGHKTLIPQLVKELINAGGYYHVAGGVFRSKIINFYMTQSLFNLVPGTAIPDAVEKILSFLIKRNNK